MTAVASALSVPLRSPDKVMRLERLGAFHPSRLSFAPTLVRRMLRERWRFKTVRWDLDTHGWGDAVYEIQTGTGGEPLYCYAFSNPLDPEDRTDRVIAEKWDAAFALSLAAPTSITLQRLRDQVPRQEAGRLNPTELVLSRANKSVRFFSYVVECLARGEQPAPHELDNVGYLMRTTAVYGNGKFGLADFTTIKTRGIFTLPFQAEMLTVFLIRHFSVQLAEHIAHARSPRVAADLEAQRARSLGIGNATGLGMAPFLINHPKLLHQWIKVRETALARVRSVMNITSTDLDRAARLMDELIKYARAWQTEDARQQRLIEQLRSELVALQQRWFCDGASLPDTVRPWDALFLYTDEHCCIETVELMVSMLLELYPEHIDELALDTGAEESWDYLPQMRIDTLRELLAHHYCWVSNIDFQDPGAETRFWYVSANKQEPRLGLRHEEPGADLELPVDIARQVHRLHVALTSAAATQTVGEFLLEHPRLRAIVRRIQTLSAYEYAEIRENLLSAETIALHMLRCKLATFGANRFDPKSDLWTRITLFQGAPLVADIEAAAPHSGGFFQSIQAFSAG